MRTFFALTLFVYLAPACHGEDWAAIHGSGLQAVRTGNLNAAVDLFQKSRGYARTDAQRAISSNDLGIVLHKTGRETEAKHSLEEALSLWKVVPGNSASYAETTAALTLVYRVLGDYSASESTVRTALERTDLNADSRMQLLSSLGDLLREEGKFNEARTRIREAEGLPGTSWRLRLDMRIAAAELERDTRNWEASSEEWNAATELARENNDQIGVASCIRGLGKTWLDRGNLARAEPLLRSALAAYQGLPVPDELQAASVLTSLGQLYLAEDKTAMAEEALRRALETEERSFGSVHPQIAVLLQILADVVARRKQLDMARGYMERAELIMSGQFTEHSLEAASVLANWGSMERLAGQPERAATRFAQALDAIRDLGGEADAFRHTVTTRYAEVLKASHRKKEAEQVLAQAHDFRSK